MSVLLPILLGLQNGTTSIEGAEPIKGSLGQKSKEQSNTSGLASTPAFPQIFRQQEETFAFLNQLPTVASFQLHDNEKAQVRPNHTEVDSINALVNPDLLERILSDLQRPREQATTEEVGRPASGFNENFDPIGFLAAQPLAVPLAKGNEAHPGGGQISLAEQRPSPVNVPITVTPPIQGRQILDNLIVSDRGVHSLEQHQSREQEKANVFIDPVLIDKAKVAQSQVLEPRVITQQVSVSKVPESGFLPQEVDPVVTEPRTSVVLNRTGEAIPQQGSLPKVAEPGFLPQPVAPGLSEKPASVALNREGQAISHTLASPIKDLPNGVEPIERFNSKDESSRDPIYQRSPTNVLAQSLKIQTPHTPPVILTQADGLAGFTDRAPISSVSLKPTVGIPSVSNDVAGSVNVHRTLAPIELPGESVSLGKGDNTQHVVEPSVKGVGLDPNSGQGLGAGLNHSSNGQSGSQQSPFSPAQGGGLRALEERRPDLPTPALQRLQMDVQLSETQRVQIDVGVHNRQVYAGLVMDHSVLRNLAAQFVPQLENQLSQVDLELQEFSAEVREERQQHADTLFHGHGSDGHQKTGSPSQSDSRSTQNLQNRYEGQGLHLVA